MKMTSRIYGIAVKETVDYYEYDDIKLVFNQDTKQWSVFSNFDNLWMNGVQYHKGDLVVMFADGKVDTYTMMAQYTDTSPYINYMYTITSNFVINPSYHQNGRVEYIFEADPETEPYQFTCKKLLNNVQQNSYTLTDVDIKTYKNQNHGKLPTLFDNMKVDWHGMNPESPYLPYSFTIISNSNYIKDGTTPKQINDIIIQIPAGSGASSYFHRILDETNKHEATPKPGELPSILMTKKIGKYNAKPSVTFNRETIIRKIYHDHTKVYYNGHYHRAMYLVYDSTGAQGCWKKTIEGLAFTYADPFWLCMTTSAGIELGGQVLEAKRLVRCWKDTDDINLTMRKTKSRKKAAPETAPYDDIIYDVVSNASNVTVTKYRRKTKIDAQGHKTTEDIQEDLPIVFDTGDSPVRCWNIEFRAKNNVWTIYSKCGYIRYGGRQYPKNRSILDFNAGEEMHIEIKDETEKYEVDEVITYTVTNVMVTKFIYKVWTVGESYTIKVEKSAENVDPEPWVTVNFYDAWNEHPVVIDDIQLDYDIKTNIWTLSSASDELYYYGRKINKGDKIAEWGFNTIISLKDERGINVISANAEKDVKVHIDSTKSQPQGLDISEFYPSNDYYNVDFLLTHSVTKGEWVITSKRDDTYMNGVRYTYNKVIFQGSDKQGYPEFTFMCQHKKDESGPIIPTRNIMYTITISWDSYEQIGNLAVQALGGESKVYYTREKDPAKNTIVLTKQNAKSMYGYIWKRDMPGPGPTPTDYSEFLIYIYCYRYYSSGVLSEILGINVLTGIEFQSKLRSTSSSSRYNVPITEYVLNRIFVGDTSPYRRYSDDFGNTFTYLSSNDFRMPSGYEYATKFWEDKYTQKRICWRTDTLQFYILAYEWNPIENGYFLVSESPMSDYQEPGEYVNYYAWQDNFDMSSTRIERNYRNTYYGYKDYKLYNKNFGLIAENPDDDYWNEIYAQYHREEFIWEGQVIYTQVEYSTYYFDEYGTNQTWWTTVYPYSSSSVSHAEHTERACFRLRLQTHYVDQGRLRSQYTDLGQFGYYFDSKTGILTPCTFSNVTEQEIFKNNLWYTFTFNSDEYKIGIEEGNFVIYKHNLPNYFSWTLVKSVPVGTKINMPYYRNSFGSSYTVVVTLGVNQKFAWNYETEKYECGFDPDWPNGTMKESTIYASDAQHYNSIRTDKAVRVRIQMDGYTNRYVNFIFDNYLLNPSAKSFAVDDTVV